MKSNIFFFFTITICLCKTGAKISNTRIAFNYKWTRDNMLSSLGVYRRHYSDLRLHNIVSHILTAHKFVIHSTVMQQTCTEKYNLISQRLKWNSSLWILKAILIGFKMNSWKKFKSRMNYTANIKYKQSIKFNLYWRLYK